MAHPLDGARAKLRRAELRRKALSRKIARHNNPLTLGVDLYPETGSDLVRVAVKVVKGAKRYPGSWGLDAGEAIQHYRTALEYVAWEAVGLCNSTWRAANERYVHFPTAECAASLGSWSATLNHLSSDHRAVFKRYQPYNRGNSALLWLKELSNDDKHKLLITVTSAANMRESFDSIYGRKDLAWPVSEIYKSWTDKIFSGPVKASTVIFETKMRAIGPEPEVYVEHSYTGEVAFESIEMGVIEVLEMISSEVSEIIEESSPFF